MPTVRHLNSLQALEAAVRLGSQKAAGEELGITAAAVGQRIRVLEDYLGTQLLERGRAGVTATPALHRALAPLGEAFTRLDEAAHHLHYASSNTVRLATNADWAALWLAPRLASFLEHHSQHEVLIETSGSTERWDLKIERSESGSAGTFLYRDYWLPLISPENHARISRAADGERLEGFPLLHFESPVHAPLDWPGWIARHGQRRSGADRGVRYLRVEPALQAVRSNAGVLLCGASLVMEMLERNEVVLPFGPAPGDWDSRAWYVTVREHALARPAVRDLLEWMLAEAGNTRAWLEALAG